MVPRCNSSLPVSFLLSLYLSLFWLPSPFHFHFHHHPFLSGFSLCLPVTQPHHCHILSCGFLDVFYHVQGYDNLNIMNWIITTLSNFWSLATVHSWRIYIFLGMSKACCSGRFGWLVHNCLQNQINSQYIFIRPAFIHVWQWKPLTQGRHNHSNPIYS